MTLCKVSIKIVILVSNNSNSIIVSIIMVVFKKYIKTAQLFLLSAGLVFFFQVLSTSKRN